jgi:hypothetical protein
MQILKWVLAGLMILLTLLVAAGIIANIPKPDANRYVTKSTPARGPDDPLAWMTAAEHLAAAQKALDEDDRNPDVTKRHWGNLAEAEKRIGYIHVEDPEFNRALEIGHEVDRRQRLMALAIGKMQRLSARERLDRTMLSAGYDVTIFVDGPWNSYLHIKHIMVGRAFVYKVTHEGDVMENIRKAGFTRIYFTDGFGFYDTVSTGLPELEPEPKTEPESAKAPGSAMKPAKAKRPKR